MKRKTQILLWIPVLAWMGLIFYFSAQDAATSSGQSGNLIRLFLGWLDPTFETLSQTMQDARVELLQHAVRKLAHMSIYLVLGALCMIALCSHRLRDRLRVAFAWGISACYAVSDEVHQTLIPGRSGELRDVLLDTCGAAVGIALVFFVWYLLKRKKKLGR